MKKLLLEKELKQFRLLMNYDPKETLTENEIPKLENEGTYYYGTLDMTSKTYGSFKNKNMFPDGPRDIYIVSASKNFPANRLSITKPKVEIKNIPGDTPEPEPKKPIPINLKLEVEDPFELDKAELTQMAKSLLDDFAKQVFGVSTEYGPEAGSAYYNYLKTIKIPIYAFASIDALSNFKDGGRWGACKNMVWELDQGGNTINVYLKKEQRRLRII